MWKNNCQSQGNTEPGRTPPEPVERGSGWPHFHRRRTNYSWALRQRGRGDLLTFQGPTGFHLLGAALHFGPIAFRRGAAHQWFQVPSKKVHARRGDLLPKGNKFEAEVRRRNRTRPMVMRSAPDPWYAGKFEAQGIPHPTHGNERAAKGGGHTPDNTSAVKVSFLWCVQVHSRMSFRRFPGFKFRIGLARHLFSMG